VTPQGEIFFRIEGDAESGVLDMYGGPSEEQLAYWRARIVEWPEQGSLFIFTGLQYPGVSDADFAAQCEGLKQEFAHIKEHTE
jgi:hypothetical protein